MRVSKHRTGEALAKMVEEVEESVLTRSESTKGRRTVYKLNHLQILDPKIKISSNKEHDPRRQNEILKKRSERKRSPLSKVLLSTLFPGSEEEEDKNDDDIDEDDPWPKDKLVIGVVKIYAIGAVDMIPSDISGKSDPYAKVSLTGKYSHGGRWTEEETPSQEYWTGIVKQSLRFEWDQEVQQHNNLYSIPILFHVPRSRGIVRIDFFDYDGNSGLGLGGVHDPLGFVEIDLENVPRNKKIYRWARIEEPPSSGDPKKKGGKKSASSYSGMAMVKLEYDCHIVSETLSMLWREPKKDTIFDAFDLNAYYETFSRFERNTLPYQKAEEAAERVVFWKVDSYLTILAMLFCLTVVHYGERFMVIVHLAVIGKLFQMKMDKVNDEKNKVETQTVTKMTETKEPVKEKKAFGWGMRSMAETMVANLSEDKQKKMATYRFKFDKYSTKMELAAKIFSWESPMISTAFLFVNLAFVALHMWLSLKSSIMVMVVGAFLMESELVKLMERAAKALKHFKKNPHLTQDADTAERLAHDFWAAMETENRYVFDVNKTSDIVKEAFEVVDQDNSGCIDRSELEIALYDLREGELDSTLEEVEADLGDSSLEEVDADLALKNRYSGNNLMKIFDDSGDGKLSLEEFEMLVHIADQTKGFDSCRVRFDLHRDHGIFLHKYKSMGNPGDLSSQVKHIISKHATHLRWNDDPKKECIEYIPKVDALKSDLKKLKNVKRMSTNAQGSFRVPGLGLATHADDSDDDEKTYSEQTAEIFGFRVLLYFADITTIEMFPKGDKTTNKFSITAVTSSHSGEKVHGKKPVFFGCRDNAKAKLVVKALNQALTLWTNGKNGKK